MTEVEHFPEPCAATGGHGPVWCAECMERWPCPSVLAGWCCARCKKAPEQHALGREAEVCVYEPAVVVPPVERCQTCIHPEGYDRLSGPCPTCDGAGAIPPGGDGYVPGAWDEVRSAYLDGHISAAAYDALRALVFPPGKPGGSDD